MQHWPLILTLCLRSQELRGGDSTQVRTYEYTVEFSFTSLLTIDVGHLIEREFAAAAAHHSARLIAGPLVARLLQRAFTGIYSTHTCFDIANLKML